MTAQPPAKPDDLELIKSTLREIIVNKERSHSAGERIEAIKLLHQLISK